MVRVYLDFKDGKWKEVEKSDFWIDRKLLQKLENLKKIQKKDWDGLILIDGKERSGKSVLAMICAWYLSDCKIDNKNYARSLEDCARQIAELPDKSIIILDEASIIFGAKRSQSKKVKLLLDILDVVGQKNLIFIFCNPSFFDLNKTIATRRSLFLLHVYPDADYRRGQYAFWGEKNKSKLYRFGKKNFDSYAYPSAEFVGQFFNFQPPFYEEYLEKIKRETLKEVLKNAMVSEGKTSIRLLDFKRLVAFNLNKKLGMSQEKIAEAFGVSQQQVSDYILAQKHKKTGEKVAEDVANRGDVPVSQLTRDTNIKTLKGQRVNQAKTETKEDITKG